MPYYNSGHKLNSGVPLGGIGAGKVEIFPDGTLANFTHQNNWGNPIGPTSGLNHIDARVGHHFAVWASRCAEGAKPIARLLQTTDIAGLPRVERIEYAGEYPFAKLNYIDPALPVQVQLEAFSPIVPGNSKTSAMPVAIFVFTLTNSDATSAVDTAIMTTARNTVSAWNVGRYNQAVSQGDVRGVLFFADSPLPTDIAHGTVCLATPAWAGEVSYHNAWNLKTLDPFNLSLQNVSLAPWDSFSVTGSLSAKEWGSLPVSPIVQGEGSELGGAIAVRAVLKPGEAKSIPFVLAWHMPHSHFGHVYENDYADAVQVAQASLGELDSLYEGAGRWGASLAQARADTTDSLADGVKVSVASHANEYSGVSHANEYGGACRGLPSWLEDAMLNNLYVLSSGSWWDREGRFALFEASRTCQLMNTVDVLYYASVPVSWCYPKLQESSITLVANAQRNDGYVPHDLGRGRIDYPSDGTTAPPRWKDLCPKFVLMVYRDVLWWGGEKLLRRLYDRVKRAMLWAIGSDRNGDHLPDNEGADQTFDNWSFQGANSYTSSIYLAGLLACERMAEAVGDHAFSRELRAKFTLGQQSFERQLWNGKYYRAVASGQAGRIEQEACTAGQLNGQWYAHLLALGYILPREHVVSAVCAMLEMNGAVSRFGAVNAVLPDGRVDRTNSHSGNVWPGETYALASLAIYEGMVDEGLELVRKVWANITDNVKNPWDQPDVIDSVTGKYGFGDHYMRNMVVWAPAFALSEYDPSVKRALDELKQDLS
jgi:non-lysosomal glucosylceramidase